MDCMYTPAMLVILYTQYENCILTTILCKCHIRQFVELPLIMKRAVGWKDEIKIDAGDFIY